ncbi:MAG: TolC family outer membrane protein [Sulfurimonas sp.]|uniref:TolC family outer membrane protein n=1 Tax=Sulfurimonas sp. TaxID=2022749 RepID=UPI00263581C5|nr:TolC family outer membrane protein [Sulfurimonas sp.]MCW8895089.1 TolC family outer membrane protein [Sulfurimonas sp.]MCW8953590.1 TolC family outer membrane protein [Sulfurimonas sp.]MCW9066957.1 TolC family outer membrane protein [Sulfurimonas sp.]
MKQYTLLSVALVPALLSAMTVTEVVQKTIETHPQMTMKRETHNAQKELLTSAKSGYLPTLDISYSVGPEHTRTIANGRETESLTRQDASATLALNVFSGFDTKYGVEQQEALILSAGNSVMENANNLALETASYYLDVLRYHELLQIAKENTEVHRKYLSQIKEKVDAGVGRASDYKQTLSRYEGALSVQYLAQQNYDNSIASFQRILPGPVSAADLEKPTIGNIPADNMESLVEIALQYNPTINVSRNDITVAKAALRRSNSAFYPRADIVATTYWNKNVHGISSSTSAVNPLGHEIDSGQNALLVLSYNIFNGMSDRANAQANQHKLLNKRSTLVDSERYIKAYTQIAWQTFESTREQLVHIEKNIDASAETVADYRKENELGRRSIIDLLNIELEYNGARNLKVTAEYDRLLAYYQILSYTGKIMEEMNVIQVCD